MNSITNELSAIQRRTRRTLYVSVGVHVILLAWLLLQQTVAAESSGLTEITWVEVAPPAQAEPAAPPVARKETKTAPTQEVAEKPNRREPEKQFRRELVRAQVEPVPQSPRAAEDVLSSKLSSLTSEAQATTTQIAQLVPPPRVGTPSLAGVETEARQSSPAELTREEVSRKSPTALSRAAPTVTQSAAVIPDVSIDTDSPRAATLQPSDARRELAGAQLVGPVADRNLVSHVTPDYPEWAKRDGVEASVTVYFLVMPDGRVKQNVLVEKTSGFGEFDENAVAAIIQWRFESVRAPGEQWGSITFHFRLTDGL